MTLEELVAASGDAKLLSYHYAEGILFLLLLLDEPDTVVEVKIRTQLLQTGSELPATSPWCCHLGRIELEPIKLEVVNGHYMPPPSFVELMKDTRSGQGLAYGSKASAVGYLFSLVGSSRVLSCLISTPNHISINAAADN
ncbi:hypothetical protein [Hymenobacter cellulosivorans]|uniref:Uncharacterized protein n=1 Tax=Hymenobacter cellulosivorans TaxID=2932249 RepID=A0ABY4FFG3_9BACT|nr:hypothetical protein [Hymenobacter cellulosivorans]UOQ55369.1 hypothetical protein MUN80_11575 [Hymenobacter cellulosivorans]